MLRKPSVRYGRGLQQVIEWALKLEQSYGDWDMKVMMCVDFEVDGRMVDQAHSTMFRRDFA